MAETNERMAKNNNKNAANETNESFDIFIPFFHLTPGVEI